MNGLKEAILKFGSYDKLFEFLSDLRTQKFIDFYDSDLDETYDDIQHEEFYKLFNIYEIELHDNEFLGIEEFLDSASFTDTQFKHKTTKYIMRYIIPNHPEWFKED